MPFLILTRAGFEDLLSKTGFSGALLYVNPAILSSEEVASLHAAGADVRILPVTVDIASDDAVRGALRFVEGQSGGPVWVEYASQVAPSSTQASLPCRQAGTPLHHRLARQAGRALHRLRSFTFRGKPLLIIPYLGYGNAYRIVVRGRVLEDEDFNAQRSDDSGWDNLVELIKRLESDQIAGARIRVRFQGVEQDAVTDRGGYFFLEIALKAPLRSSGWHTAELELLAPLPADGMPVCATAEVLVPSPAARFGVISDIDDTIVWTNVTNRLNMMLMLARSNAHTRKPFKGAAAFYRALHEGFGSDENNPFFYVSSSPWHLFTPLVEFLRVQHFPLGPLMLKELGLRKVFGSERHRNHKLDNIESILRFYPHLRFILVGDSGEQDPEIYAEIVKRYPRMVHVIYIRSVNPDPSRIEAIDRLIEEVHATGTQLILAPDSEFAAAHAAAEGLIRACAMVAVRLDKKEDES